MKRVTTAERSKQLRAQLVPERPIERDVIDVYDPSKKERVRISVPQLRFMQRCGRPL